MVHPMFFDIYIYIYTRYVSVLVVHPPYSLYPLIGVIFPQSFVGNVNFGSICRHVSLGKRPPFVFPPVKFASSLAAMAWMGTQDASRPLQLALAVAWQGS